MGDGDISCVKDEGSSHRGRRYQSAMICMLVSCCLGRSIALKLE